MIRAEGLTKTFAGGVVALDGVSFEARPGEVLGFLGPNGAGKTTAMRILAGYIAPTRGRAIVCGRDVAEDSRGARARIGYLPESVPLYPEMRVDEYLRYRAALKRVPRGRRRARIDDAAAQAGIADARRRVIGQLSKGYRQRVGLADALLHEPEALILDEPTDGLDPNQRRDVLALIAELGRARTVILSTHILPEVESVCGRVVILDRGRVIAAGRPAELASGTLELRVVARGDRDQLLAAVRAVDGVTRVDAETATATETATETETETETETATETATAPRVVTLTVACARDVREEVAAAVVAAGGRLRELRPLSAGLDEIFARLTRPERTP